MSSKFKNMNAAPTPDELERTAAGADELVMFSARITKDDQTYIKNASFHLDKSKQEILAEALELFREKYPFK